MTNESHVWAPNDHLLLIGRDLPEAESGGWEIANSIRRPILRVTDLPRAALERLGIAAGEPLTLMIDDEHEQLDLDTVEALSTLDPANVLVIALAGNPGLPIVAALAMRWQTVTLEPDEHGAPEWGIRRSADGRQQCRRVRVW